MFLIKLTRVNLYIIFIVIFGLISFLLHIDFTIKAITDWTIFIYLVLSIIFLINCKIILPPKGNALTMESGVYLASTFIFGVETTLAVLLIGNIAFALLNPKIKWWKHLLNFTNYSIMTIGAYYTFILIGGEVGSVQLEKIYIYVITLIAYYTINVFLVGSYFYLASSSNVFKVFKTIVSETLFGYLCTLVMSVVLAILIVSHDKFGLVLFTGVVGLLSVAFKQYYNLYEKVAKKANTDLLTGLYNHSYFKEVLTNHLKNNDNLKLSLALIDIDDFKKYNDYYGHLAGDDLLKYIGNLLSEGCKENNFFVARYGGEEFVIIMKDVDRSTALKFLNTLRKQVNDSYFNGVEILPHRCLSFSGGVVEYEKGIYSINELIDRADQAMYFAKAQGKNNCQPYDSKNISLTILEHEKELELLEQQVKIFLYKDVYTYQHSRRVYQYARDFAYKLNLSDYEKKLLISGALIHDIGKLEIPRDIINKKGKLEPFEWEIIKKHVTWGKEIVATNKDLHDLIPLVELHHERYDGRGYPYGLQGESTPKLARILCIIDSFDAMTTERPYQKTKTFDEAIEELKQCAGKQFDPNYVPAFIEMVRELYPLKFTENSITKEKVTNF
ncbi:diguanylate cyclase [Anaerobacillus alkaliphilus]|uniref:Diguanylate cyclase n=1 Tax=Anaerobacillus alkaliphilus TaxID=1548597 RepID=A0A4Q0VUH9_9BACI|nr:diguanylate cyclase [Anaerobacillus alkaliphilus]